MEEREPPFKTLAWEEDPLTGELVPEIFLLEREFGEAEKLAEPVVEGLRAAIAEGRGRIQLISVKAAIAEAQLTEGDKETKTRKRRGPKGPRKPTILRRSTIKLLRNDGITGRRLCEELDKRSIPLPTKDLNLIYDQSWVKWFDSDKVATQRQLSADFTRPSGSSLSSAALCQTTFEPPLESLMPTPRRVGAYFINDGGADLWQLVAPARQT